MSNYSKVSVESSPRVELHEVLGLTGCELTINTLPAGVKVPFVHAHKENEEVYYVLSGEGKTVIDNEEVSLKANDCVRVSPSSDRQFMASETCPITYICIQVKENSLTNYTMTDAIIK